MSPAKKNAGRFSYLAAAVDAPSNSRTRKPIGSPMTPRKPAATARAGTPRTTVGERDGTVPSQEAAGLPASRPRKTLLACPRARVA